MSETLTRADSAPEADQPAAADRPAREDVPALADMLAFARAAAADPEVISRLPLHPEERTWVRLEGPGGCEAWLIGWPPGSETGWHDHGGSSGAFVTAEGELSELSLGVPIPTDGWRSLELEDGVDRQRSLPAGTGRAFGAHHVHQVVNPSDDRHAVSVHCYYPPLPKMRRYARSGDVLRLSQVEIPEEW
ncbi:cysteine dioxygenase [Streptacidiphilus sp. PB12-B1b]|uniref:cysteine dioxygenase n=1 Tax=Streptacidiphilus sp. PB12-B1b TaxID=2705012 RepID=UPI001CDBE991|nr:cysteine dioxygenase [Streptacidiphilus sp. PB12-B1b]